MNDTLRLKIEQLPDSPGCYLMKENGHIIYVGKAVNLKNRVRSYFRATYHTPKVAAMISHITDFDILLCRTNLEALILECNLIKLHKPYYNILLKDDKHYPYIRIDMNAAFPAVRLARRVEKDGARYFGPYIGANAVKDVLETLKKLFPLRGCKQPDITPDARHRPCLNYEIGRCMAPCAGKCSPEAYRRMVENVCSFLSGRENDIVKGLEAQMRQAALEMRYEQAAQLRDKIRDIQGLMQQQQAIRLNAKDQDIFALCQDGMDAMAQILHVRNGKMVGGDSYPLPGEGSEDRDEVLFEFMMRYYDEFPPPGEVIVSSCAEEIREDLQEWLSEKREKSRCVLTVPVRGEKRALVMMAEKNANDQLKKRNADHRIQEERTTGACRELMEKLQLKEYPRRIEGFDISNTMGELSVASMVVFIDGERASREYRKYRIKTVEGPNDFASMAEVIDRRLKRVVHEDEKQRWVKPDLILVDGGPEQLAFAQRSMKALGLDIQMIGLAKRLEEVWLPDADTPVMLDKNSAALHLLQAVRDESHRFAITEHRALRTKKQNHSSL